MKKTKLASGKAKVTFELPPAITADDVVVCGDFNGWGDEPTPLARRKDGRFSTTVTLAQNICNLGGNVRLEEYVGAVHTDIAFVSANDVVTWIGQRFAGQPATSTCGQPTQTVPTGGSVSSAPPATP